LIRGLQGRRNVPPRGEKQRSVGKPISDRDRIDVRGFGPTGVVRNHRKRFIGGEFEWLVLDLVPNGFVNSLRVAPRWREEIDEQQVDSLVEKA
jgi:hypothetical protein